jgi:UDP-glucose:(heptosyl)LPS alpha-1,3-glucosyltransferase
MKLEHCPMVRTAGRRIAIAIQSLDRLGGKERDALAIAAGLAARGYAVTILSRSVRLPIPIGIEVREVGSGGWTNHDRASFFARAVAGLRSNGDLDVLLSFDKLKDADVYYAADVCLRPSLRGFKLWLPRYATYARLEADCFGPDGPDILFLCRKQEGEYRRCYPLGEQRAAVLPPMIHDPDRQEFYSQRAAVRRKFDIPESASLAVSVAVYPRQKGIDRTITALRAVPALHLLGVGLKDTAAASALAKREGVQARTRLVGYSDQVSDILGAADLMLHPARVENTGLVILESLLAGVPVIASAACGFSEFIQRFGAGIVLADPFDPAEYEAAIRASLAPGRLVELRSRARNCAPHLRAEGGLDRILDVIEQTVIQRSQRKSGMIDLPTYC